MVSRVSLVSLVLFVALGQCIYFEIKPGQEKCFKQDFQTNALTSGKIEVSPVFDEMALLFRVSDF